MPFVFDQNMYLGGVPSFDLVSPYVPIRTGFKGCIQKVRSQIPLDLTRASWSNNIHKIR